MTERYDAEWMSGFDYDSLRARDFALFCKAASMDRAARVPTCPEWNVAELCDHLARVYQGRAYAIEHAAFKSTDDFLNRADRVDPINWVRDWSDSLDRALLNRADDAPTITFMPEATTVHFWRRRMSLETLVHRIDVELAVGDATAMDVDLSADGVDELLWFGSAEPEIEQADGDHQTTVLELINGERRWVITLDESGLSTTDSSAPRDATVFGSAPALLLALSGRDIEEIGVDRLGLEPPVVEGDPFAFDRLRGFLGAF